MKLSDIRKIAISWLVVGLMGSILITLSAISYYVFKMPMHEGHSDRLASPSTVAMTLLALGGGFGLFAALGGAVLLWLRSRPK